MLVALVRTVRVAIANLVGRETFSRVFTDVDEMIRTIVKCSRLIVAEEIITSIQLHDALLGRVAQKLFYNTQLEIGWIRKGERSRDHVPSAFDRAVDEEPIGCRVRPIAIGVVPMKDVRSKNCTFGMLNGQRFTRIVESIDAIRIGSTLAVLVCAIGECTLEKILTIIDQASVTPTQVDSKMPTMGAERPRKKFGSNSFRSVKFRTPRNEEHRALSISDALDARRSTTRLLFECAQSNLCPS